MLVSPLPSWVDGKEVQPGMLKTPDPSHPSLSQLIIGVGNPNNLLVEQVRLNFPKEEDN